ncbi:MAG TPA: GTPase HflX, partial [Methylomirabilota bacterium]|nr:GTPase HflX [Methylomirabilota bacterium]
LVAAFKATLEELEEADVLVHVVDASHPGLDEQMQAVDSLLAELDLGRRPTIVALNKVDRLEEGAALGALVDRFEGAALSARTGEGVDALLDRIARALRPGVERVRLRIPYRDGTAIGLCYERGRVLARSDDADGIHLEVELSPRLLASVEPYRLTG